MHPDYRFIIETASKAPSGHNTQPWLFKINEGTIEISPDMTRALPVVDPDNRELFISLGCALENLCIAAAAGGYSTNIGISADGIITVNLSAGTGTEENSLLGQIPLRQTNRRIYTGQEIPQETIETLEKNVADDNVSIHFFKNGTRTFDTLKGCIAEGNSVQMRDAAFKRELKSWFRYNKKHSNETLDGLAYDVFGAPDMPRFITRKAMDLAITGGRQVKGDNRKIESSSHLVLFTVHTCGIPQWIMMGRKLQKFLLQTTFRGVSHAYLNQPVEIESLREKVALSLGLDGEIPVILLRLGYGKPMPYSRRRSITTCILQA